MFEKTFVAQYNDWMILAGKLGLDGKVSMLVETSDESFDEKFVSHDDLFGLEFEMLSVVAKEDFKVFQNLKLDVEPLEVRVWNKTDSKFKFLIEIDHQTNLRVLN
jgi:hypothetical protein